MITVLELENFRGVKKGRIELAPLTILLGGNNSGKTTILEALFLAPNPFRGVPYSLKPYNAAVAVLRYLHETLDSKGYAFLLYNYILNSAKISCRADNMHYSLVFSKEQPSQDLISVILTKQDSSWTVGRLSTVHDNITPISSELYMKNTLLISSKLRDYGYRYIEENWAAIINLGICRKVAKETSELVSENYIDITMEPFLGGQLAIYAFLEDGRRIRLGDLGEGVQNYILARVLYEVAKPETLLWDDVEAHFNPRMLLRIAEWFSELIEKNKQVIVSTHSLEAAKIIAGMAEEKARIYLTSLKDGELKAKSLTLKEVEELQEAGIDVRVAEPMLL